MKMSEIIRIKKGLDINLKGKADKIYIRAPRAKSYAVKPTDFHGIRPKLLVQPGDEVNVGTTLFFNKYNPRVKFSSPVSGTVSEIVRGERRMILEVVIEPKEVDKFLEYKVSDPKSMSREKIVEVLLESGMWPLIRQRPYSIIANPEHKPKAIFISGFDSAPLAPDLEFILKDFKDEFQKGLDVISKLTDGKIHLGLNAAFSPCKTYSEAKGVEVHKFKGPHPAGNVGIQIHHIDPINKGDIVWYLAPQDVLSIGNLFTNGKIDNNLYLALTGSEIKKPVYYKLLKGAAVNPILDDNLKKGELRIISGNVLTGTKISKTGFIGFYDNHITVIPEGNYYEFVGWATPGFGKYSVSRTFFSWLTPKKEFTIDTNLKGGKRAFVMTGEYNKVLPMDIYPVQLLKSILVDDIDQMEKLGIYEVAEEDFALCEFVCTSKTNVQEILRKGLDLMRKETE
jgi:Na+-transporting NADH:ubiquinone oxidoreductase subunit A